MSSNKYITSKIRTLLLEYPTSDFDYTDDNTFLLEIDESIFFLLDVSHLNLSHNDLICLDSLSEVNASNKIHVKMLDVSLYDSMSHKEIIKIKESDNPVALNKISTEDLTYFYECLLDLQN